MASMLPEREAIRTAPQLSLSALKRFAGDIEKQLTIDRVGRGK